MHLKELRNNTPFLFTYGLVCSGLEVLTLSAITVSSGPAISSQNIAQLSERHGSQLILNLVKASRRSAFYWGIGLLLVVGLGFAISSWLYRPFYRIGDGCGHIMVARWP